MPILQRAPIDILSDVQDRPDCSSKERARIKVEWAGRSLNLFCSTIVVSMDDGYPLSIEE